MKRRIKPSSAKAKGRSLQQWACQKISELLGIPWGKDELIASREMGQAGTDVRLMGEAQERFRFSVECKNQERLNVWDALAQAEANATNGSTPLLVFKRNRTQTYVALSFDDFMELVGTKCQHE